MSKQKILKIIIRNSFSLIAVIFVSFMFTHEVFAACGDGITGGAGTSGDPYQINSASELAAISSCLGSGNSGKYFKLMNDINLDVNPYNTGSGWTPIGTASGSSGFYGKFNGDYHTISGLYISRPSTSNVALFGYTEVGAVIENVLLEDVDVDGGNIYVGSLVGYHDGTVQNSGVTGGTVKGFMRFGGLVGYNAGLVQRVFSQDVTVTQKAATNQCCVGGLIGGNESSGILYDSYSRSNVVHTSGGQGGFGGAIGNTYGSGAMSRIYSTGTITSLATMPGQIGGLVGTSYVLTSSSYWDTQTSGQATSASGTGKTTAQMKDQATYSGWDFSTVWAIDGVNNDGYPYLLWQDFSDVTAPTILSVSSSTNNGSYNEGDIVAIDVTFSESVTSAGDVTVTLETGDTDRTCVFSVTNSTTGTCNYTVQSGDISADLTVLSISGTITDASANSMTDFVPSTNLAANKAIVIDTINPTISTFSPSDNATNISTSVNFVINFDEVVSVGSGNITIKKTIDDTEVEVIDVTSGLVTGGGTSSVTINPSVTLDSATSYYVHIDATAFDDQAGNSFVGISDNFTWNITTVDTGNPAVVGLSPVSGAMDISITEELSIEFDEIVVVDTGNVSLYLSDDTLVENIDVTSEQVTGSGTNTITVNPSSNLDYQTSYYIHIDATAFDDEAGNSFAGISDDTTWTFTTEEEEIVAEPEEETPRVISTGIMMIQSKNIFTVLQNKNIPYQEIPQKKTFEVLYNTEIDLHQGITHENVRELQKFLNEKGFTVSESGFGSPGNETNYFGQKTQKALIEFQKENNIFPSHGYFGPKTRKYISYQ